MSKGEEKTESPTPYKLSEARKKGQIGKSTDVVAFFSFSFAFMALYLAFNAGITKWFNFFREINNYAFTSNNKPIQGILSDSLNLCLLLSLPILLACMLGGIFGSVGQFGFLLSSHPLKFKLDKLNPIKGAKKLFSKTRLVELIKQIIKFTLVFGIIFIFLHNKIFSLSLLLSLEFSSSLLFALNSIIDVTLKVLLGFLLISIVDFFWQKHSFLKSMRMSKYEVKKEYKQQEGDPQLKSERKRIAHEYLEQSAKDNVKNAKVIIVNPTHIAVAISYDEEKSDAPIICAKGVQKVAKEIIKIARYNDVPVIRNVPLARQLYQLDMEQEIPEHLYDIVAEVLAFVHNLNEKADLTSAKKAI